MGCIIRFKKFKLYQKEDRNLNDINPVLFVVFAVLAVFALIFFAVFAMVFRPWLRACLHGTPVPFPQIIAMRLRGNPPILLIDAYINLRRAEISTTIGEVENVYIDSRSRILTSDDLVNLVKQREHSS